MKQFTFPCRETKKIILNTMIEAEFLVAFLAMNDVSASSVDVAATLSNQYKS